MEKLTVFVILFQMVLRMSNLLYRNCSSGERGFLATVAFKLDTMLLIQDSICGDRRMVATDRPKLGTVHCYLWTEPD